MSSYSNYSYSTGTLDPDMAAGMMLVLGIVSIISLVIGIITLVAQWKLLKKMGRHGWACIIPIYNMWEYGAGAFVSRGKTILLTVLSAVFYVAFGVLYGSMITTMMETGATSVSYEAEGAAAIPGLILGVVAIALLVLEIMLFVAIAKSFGKSGALALLGIFIPPVYWWVLGFSSAPYLGPEGTAAYNNMMGAYPQQGGYPAQQFPPQGQPNFQQPQYGQQQGFQQTQMQPQYGQQPYQPQQPPQQGYPPQH